MTSGPILKHPQANDSGRLARPGRLRERGGLRLLPGRVALNLGTALDDMATAIHVYRQAMEQGIGTFLPL